jgi:hypothetical protein
MTNEQITARCKANAMTLIRLFREAGGMTEPGIKMLDDVESWVKTPECDFTNLAFTGDAPAKADRSMLQDLWKAYKAGQPS